MAYFTRIIASFVIETSPFKAAVYTWSGNTRHVMHPGHDHMLINYLHQCVDTTFKMEYMRLCALIYVVWTDSRQISGDVDRIIPVPVLLNWLYAFVSVVLVGCSTDMLLRRGAYRPLALSSFSI